MLRVVLQRVLRARRCSRECSRERSSCLRTLSFLSLVFLNSLVNFKQGISLVIVRFLWFFQGFSGFGRGQKSLVNLRFFLGKTEKPRKGRIGYLVTRIASTSKSQIASDCNRNSKKSLRLRKDPLKPTLWTREPPVLCGFYSVSEAPHGSGNPPEYVATTRV